MWRTCHAVVLLLAAAALAHPPQESDAMRLAESLASMGTQTTGRSFDPKREPASVWHQRGREQLQRALRRNKISSGVARNVVLFVGDGMGLATVTAAGVLKGGEGHMLSWEQFPVVGLAKTYSVDHTVPDSASTATAFLTGSKTFSRMLGLDATANKTYCDRELNAQAALTSAALWAQEAGKVAGLVTTARITHATPAALYARINHRDWECDGEIPPESKDCVADIARQLVEQQPGRDLRVVLGGGRRQMGASGIGDPDEDDSCVRTDGRDLSAEWSRLGGRRSVVTTARQLEAPDLLDKSDYVLGLFAGGHMAYDAERPQDQPSLATMTRVALRALRRQGPQGFFLLVEGARVDMAHHLNYARLALLDALQLDQAVEAALQEVDLEDTLVLLTADHSHTMAINGYPERGADILGVAYAEDKQFDPQVVKYETLTYSTGPGAKYHENRTTDDVTDKERAGLRYPHQAGWFTGEDETHAGEDVPVYAVGPGSELFGGVYEQSYIGSAMAYAAGIGMYGGEAKVQAVQSSLSETPKSSATTLESVVFLVASFAWMVLFG